MTEVIFSKQSILISQSIPEQVLCGYFPKSLATEFDTVMINFAEQAKSLTFIY